MLSTSNFRIIHHAYAIPVMRNKHPTIFDLLWALHLASGARTALDIRRRFRYVIITLVYSTPN